MKHDLRNQSSASPSDPAVPSSNPGKRTLTEPHATPGQSSSAPGKQSAAALFAMHPQGPRDWMDLVTLFGIPRPSRVEPPADTRTPANPRAGQQTIQRQENPDAPAGAGGACLDPEGIRDEMQRIVNEANQTFDPERLRELAGQVEIVARYIDRCGDPRLHRELSGLLASTRDALVARFQAAAASHASQTLQAWWDPATTADARRRQRVQYQTESGFGGNVEKGTVSENWCGMFTNAQFRAAGFAPAFNMAFNSADDVAQFFSYTVTSRCPGTIRPYGTQPEVPLHQYHIDRGSERTWRRGAEIGSDIRAGDVVTLQLDADAPGDHICIVKSYTRRTDGHDQLVTIDGNAYGARMLDARPPPGQTLPADQMTTLSSNAAETDVSTSTYKQTGDAAHPSFDRSSMVSADHAFQVMTLVGRGRPSLVDFEDRHAYPGFTGDTNGPGGPIQRKERGAGAIPGDPNGAFDAATGGGASEIPYRAEMQQRFHADFSSVQSYTGRDLGALSAHAATRGEQVVFASDSPDRETVAHELTHVVQSRNGAAGNAALSDPGDASEREARGAAASVAAGEPLALGAAPSAAIHRQDDRVPTPVQPVVSGNRQDTSIDWSIPNFFISKTYRLPINNSAPASIREVYEFFLLQQLRAELGDLVTAYIDAGNTVPDDNMPSLPDGRHARHAAVEGLNAFIQGRIQSLMTSDPTAAERRRVRLFAANQQALATALLIPGSSRYTPGVNAKGERQTWCNIFSYDMVTAMGGYLPRVWWTAAAETKFETGQQPSPGEVQQMRANDLHDWMVRWGVTQYGWRSVDTSRAAQDEANAGRLVIILGTTGYSDRPGHVSVVMTETPGVRDHPSGGSGDNIIPLQSQAGAENFATNAANVPAEQVGSTGRSTWWTDDPDFNRPHVDKVPDARAGFFVYDAARRNRGFGARPVRTPEEMGTVLPQASTAASSSGVSSR